MRCGRFLAVLGFIWVALSGSAHAQAQQLVGQWQCQSAAKAHNNDLTQAQDWQFTLVLNANGQFQAQGSYFSPSIGYKEQYAGQGTWTVGQDQGRSAMLANGSWWRSGIGNLGNYTFGVWIQDGRTMIYNTRDQYTQLSAMCQR